MELCLISAGLQRYVAHVDEVVVCRSCDGGLEEKGEDDCEVAELVEVHGAVFDISRPTAVRRACRRGSGLPQLRWRSGGER